MSNVHIHKVGVNFVSIDSYLNVLHSTNFMQTEIPVRMHVHFHAGPSTGPVLLSAKYKDRTTVKLSWNRPEWKQYVNGYWYLLLNQGHVIYSSTLKPSITSVNIDNRLVGKNSYEFRVAGILRDGTVSKFSPTMKIDQTTNGE